ncbi:SDR family NAD(P)-dependent oxidoreductase [Sediminicurvatus halobius]|uniref:Short-chain dehydrogenase n=1 Tax=Sediminicurvatus halobius TaxID=2182432 RepID=A0A2U2MX89_9GAMM|nr:SDR family oxidoreductase [Spiribacter halobius]PWG61477.1 short-chain dehydrogenase [Spiribacter halobius]UEX77985.1 SDR family oxidoreductase [Spiribacter halobius]
MRLKDKVAIVTGGGSGIGQGICDAFVREGARVVVADINLPNAEAVALKLNERANGAAHAIKVDVTDEQSTKDLVRDAVAHFGTLNILVNNAGARTMAPFEEHTTADWQKMLDINLTGPFLCSRAAVPELKKNEKAKIINLASIASFMGRPDRAGYVAAKTGVLGLTRSMAVDLAEADIRVNCLAPGMIATPFNAMFADDPETGPEWKKENFVGRWGKPEDIAMAAVFLASEESDFVTGAELKVEGGWLAAKFRKGEMSD